MPNHLYPVVKDTPDKRDHLAAPRAIVLPSSVSLRPYLGPVKDQGSLGSCTAHAGTGLREFLYRRFYHQELHTPVAPNTFRLSPLFLYAMERQIEGDFGTDCGAQSRTIYQALSTYGCALESLDPYLSANAEVMPGPTVMAAALLFKSISFHRCPDVDTVKSVLASGYCVTVGMPLYEAFESNRVAATGNVPLPSGQSIGGHEMLISGYNDAHAAFDVRNSWGADWGDGGNCWIPYAYFDAPGVMAQTDFWTAHLGRPWA